MVVSTSEGTSDGEPKIALFILGRDHSAQFKPVPRVSGEILIRQHMMLECFRGDCHEEVNH